MDESSLYTYNARVLRFIDGDTIEVAFNLGFHVEICHVCRIWGVNAPEKNTEAGKLAKEWLVAQLPVDMTIIVQTMKDRSEKFGRILVKFALDGIPVNEAIVAAGHGVPYFGGKR